MLDSSTTSSASLGATSSSNFSTSQGSTLPVGALASPKDWGTAPPSYAASMNPSASPSAVPSASPSARSSVAHQDDKHFMTGTTGSTAGNHSTSNNKGVGEQDGCSRCSVLLNNKIFPVANGQLAPCPGQPVSDVLEEINEGSPTTSLENSPRSGGGTASKIINSYGEQSMQSWSPPSAQDPQFPTTGEPPVESSPQGSQSLFS